MHLFLDACAIIYWVEMTEPHFAQFSKILQLLKKKYHKPNFIASSLSLLECRVKPMRENNEDLLKHYQDFFTMNNLTILNLSFEIIEHATRLRANHQLRTPDALQAASALTFSDKVLFITGDASFKKVPNLEVILIH